VLKSFFALSFLQEECMHEDRKGGAHSSSSSGVQAVGVPLNMAGTPQGVPGIMGRASLCHDERRRRSRMQRVRQVHTSSARTASYQSL
jgi:hypothetical protein